MPSYYVYHIVFSKPDTLNGPMKNHEGLLLAPIARHSTSSQVYLLQYAPAQKNMPRISMPKKALPSWERAKIKSSGLFSNAPTNPVETEIYKTVDFPIHDLSLVGECADVEKFVKTAETISKFDHGQDNNASQNWMNDVLNSVTSQHIYNPLISLNWSLFLLENSLHSSCFFIFFFFFFYRL